MPITHDRLKDQLESLNKQYLFHQTHFKQAFRELIQLIDEKEIIEDICGVDTLKKNYLMVVTNKRLLFVNSCLAGFKKELHFNYKNLRSVEYKKGLLFHKIIVHTRDGRKYTFASRTNEGCEEITRMISEKIKYLL